MLSEHNTNKENKVGETPREVKTLKDLQEKSTNDETKSALPISQAEENEGPLTSKILENRFRRMLRGI